MDALALLGLLGLLFVKEAGLPVPVPGDLLVIGAGVAVAGVPLAGLAVLAAILVVGYAGGSVQFLLARGARRCWSKVTNGDPLGRFDGAQLREPRADDLHFTSFDRRRWRFATARVTFRRHGSA